MRAHRATHDAQQLSIVVPELDSERTALAGILWQRIGAADAKLTYDYSADPWSGQVETSGDESFRACRARR